MGRSSPICVLAKGQTGRLPICSDKTPVTLWSTSNFGAERFRLPLTTTFLAPSLENRLPCSLLVEITKLKSSKMVELNDVAIRHRKNDFSGQPRVHGNYRNSKFLAV